MMTQETALPAPTDQPVPELSKADLIRKRLAEVKAKAQAKNSQADQSLTPVIRQEAPIEQLSNGVALIVQDTPRTELSQSTEYAQYYAQMCELEQKLNEQIPDFTGQLRYLHRVAAEDPNVVTIMTDEELGIIVRGLARMVDIEIVTPKETGTRKKKLANVSSDDI